MAHYIKVTEDLNTDVGMSTHIKYIPGGVFVTWKRGENRAYPAQIGDRLQINTGCGFPEVRVMRPPKGKLERVAWEYNFFSKKRAKSLEELEQKAAGDVRYSSPHGCDIPNAAVFRGEKCAVTYRGVLEGQLGVPWLWWAEQDAEPVELEKVIKNALQHSAMALYT